MSDIKQAITVEQRRNYGDANWDVCYYVQQAINITTPKINDILTEDEINKLIKDGIKITIKPIN